MVDEFCQWCEGSCIQPRIHNQRRLIAERDCLHPTWTCIPLIGSDGLKTERICNHCKATNREGDGRGWTGGISSQEAKWI